MDKERSLPMLPSAYQACYESHEPRVAKLESDNSDQKAVIKLHDFRLNGFEDRFDELSTKLDANQVEMSKTIHDSLAPIHQSIKVVSETLTKGMERVDSLEISYRNDKEAKEKEKADKERAESEAKAESKKKKDRLVGLFWTAIGALITVTLKDGLPYFWGIIHK